MTEETYPIIAGVDEAGRGPLAGPVIAAAVILDEQIPITGLRDSKQLSHKQHQLLADEITANARAWATGRAEVVEIDQLNILRASLLAMQRAIAALPVKPQKVLVDGQYVPELDCAAEAIIKGDSLVAAISAASILAKLTRDVEMIRLHQLYPDYGFAQHKGYPTKQHIAALKKFGVTRLHRRHFGPVARLLNS